MLLTTVYYATKLRTIAPQASRDYKLSMRVHIRHTSYAIQSPSMQQKSNLPLFQAHPILVQKLPYQPLGTLPTPVQKLEALSTHLGHHHLYIKRDDLSGPLYGGNKVRKLEFIFGEALAKGFKEVVTLGAIGSHHVLATSIYARELGLTPYAHHFPQPVSQHVLNNLLALSSTHPSLTLVGHPVELPFHQFKKQLMGWLQARQKTYYIKGGGSSLAGIFGYVNAALELQQQIEEGLLPCPDEIYVAAGTNGTLAGLILGAKMAKLSSKIIGVRVVDRVVTNSANVLALANAASATLNNYGVSAPLITLKDFDLLHNHFGKAYGQPTHEGAEASALLMEHESLKLDPTYTAKTFSAVVKRARQIDEAKTILYWHTLNGIDLSERIQNADYTRDLPEEYHTFFEDRA